MFSVIEKATGRWIGRARTVDARRLAGQRDRLGDRARLLGPRLCDEGAVAATNWAFDHLGWTQIIHSIAPENAASQGVARKLGSRNWGPGRLPPPYRERSGGDLGTDARGVAGAPGAVTDERPVPTTGVQEIRERSSGQSPLDLLNSCSGLT